MKPFIRRTKYGVSKIVRQNYNTDTWGQQTKNYWYALREEICRRDNNTCIWCKKPSSEVHHIVPLSKGGVNSKTNMACICKTCHDRRHPHLHSSRTRPKFTPPF